MSSKGQLKDLIHDGRKLTKSGTEDAEDAEDGDEGQGRRNNGRESLGCLPFTRKRTHFMSAWFISSELTAGALEYKLNNKVTALVSHNILANTRDLFDFQGDVRSS